ncbi:MAG TPA: hypothetical protein PLZ95_19185, partial [Bryobacteraceae bacterium]|nr:hypothetical protein [Bryobacteraceae bacterium]
SVSSAGGQPKRHFYHGLLEDKVESIIRVGLPSADVHRGTKFTIGSAEFENDLLVCLGNWLILIEAKSHKINAAARRGAPGSLDEQIRRLIERPSQQSARFAEYLSSEPRKHRLTSKKGLPYELNSADISRILRLNVSLEAVGSPLSTEVRAMQESGFISGGQKPALTINLFDLAVVFEVLLSEEERADYLYRRLDLQAGGRFDGDERDLLLFYIAAQMRTSYPSKDCFVRLAGLGRQISDFYPPPSSGMKRVRPVRRYTPFWRRTIEFLRGYRGLYWPEAAILLLTASIEEQLNFEKGLRKCLQKPASAHGLTITAQGWNETNVVLGAVIRPTAPRMPSLREQGLNQLRLGKADQVLLLGFDSHLHPVEVLMLTSRERPIWI